MIYKTIIEWLEGKIDVFNIPLSDTDKLKKIDVNLDLGFLPANMKDKRYLVTLSGIEEDPCESHFGIAKVMIEFHFTLFKKPIEYYEEIIDKYLLPLAVMLEDDTVSGLEFESNGILLANLRELEITGLDKLDKGGKFILPSIKFGLEFIIN
jgi:hypothetical protein